MATRSYIGVRNTDGSVDYIYCHFDGYPDGVGKTLTKYYSKMNQVSELMELGDLSVLGEQIGEQHDFDSPVKGWCRAYGRDRGEVNVGVKNSNFRELINDQNVDYVYVFDGDYWECFDPYFPDTIINLYNMASSEA